MSASQLTPSGEKSPSIAPPDLTALIFLLPFAVYVLHTLEEMQGFAAWATRHFGPETTDNFAAYHIPLMLLVLACSAQAVRSRRRAGWVIMTTAFQWQFFVNALFHLSTWFVLQEYSPGAVTAAVVAIPATVVYFTWLLRERRAAGTEVLVAVSIGTLVAGLAIGFLFM